MIFYSYYNNNIISVGCGLGFPYACLLTYSLHCVAYYTLY